MQSLKEYTKQTNKHDYIQFVHESVDNNVRMINESELLIKHGKDLDNLLYKFNSYTRQSLYNANKLNESDDNYKLTLNEQELSRDMLIYMCEEYKDQLLKELNIYESLLTDENYILNEGLFNGANNIASRVKQTWSLGKEKIKQAVETIKTKINEVNELIKKFALKAIKTVKEMALNLISLLDKFNCTLQGLFEKMGLDVDKEEESVIAIGDELSKNVEQVKKQDIYESYGNELKLIIEDAENQEENQGKNQEGETVPQVDKVGTKQMIWNACKQLMVWAGVCVIIPGIVCGLFPGTLIALIVPVACKLLWNAYKIKKIYDQWKKVKKEWGTYTTFQKCLTACGMVASIIALAVNFGSIAKSVGPLWEALTKSGVGLFEKANLGIQPDVLTRAVGAAVKNISEGKWPWEDFGKSFNSITDAFAEHIPQPDKVINATAKVGQSGEELLKQFDDKTFKSSTKAWTEFLKPAGMDVNKLNPKGIYDVVMDGHQDAAWFTKLAKFAHENGVDISPSDGFNKGLNKLCSNAGSITGAKLPGWLIKKAMEEGINIGNKGIFSVLGGVIETVQNIPSEDLINAATSMLATIPSVEFAPQNNGGFRVRLGGENDEKNCVYEVGKEGVRKVKVSDFQEKYDKIKKYVEEVNVKFLKELKDNDKIDEDTKKEIEKNSGDFNEKYQKVINKQEAIVFYGKLVEDKSTNKSTNESYKSLYNYLLLEAKKAESVQDVIDNLTALRNHLQSKCIKADKENQKNKELVKDNTPNNQSNTFAGNVKMLLQRIFSFKSQFKFVDSDDESNKLSDTEEKKNIYTTKDIDAVALYLSNYIYNDTDNDKYFEELRKALIDVTIIKNQAKENSDNISDELKGAYNNMLELLQKSPKFKKESDGDEPEWEPLYFDEVAPEIQDKIQDAEDKLPETTPEETEKELKDNDIVIPKQKEEDKNNDDKEIPILMFANVYGMDIAKANDKGPRPDPYSLKGVFHSITISEIEGGTSKTNIQKLFGDILSTQTSALYDIVANKPCDKKHKLHSWNKGDEERADFGMLTNQDITDILNNPNKAKDFVLEKSSISIVRSDEDKEFLKKKQDQYKEKLENPSDEEKEILKKMGALDDEGKVKDIESLSSDLASYRLAQKQSKEKGAKEDKSIFGKIRDFVTGLFGGDKKKAKANNELIKHFEQSKTNESISINQYDQFLDDVFRKSLSEYIHEKLR